MSQQNAGEPEAGRELDARIAERVLGWKPLSGAEIPEAFTSREVSEPHLKRVWVLDGERMACEECGTLPMFSDDIAAAWRVLEKFAHNMRGRLNWPILWSEGRSWWCEIGKGKASATTAPLAICRAALKAVVRAGQERTDAA